ncbi:hypothetical protein [Chryseobacterium caseinilyticum]|uniref:Uncharacterized protein n=1 Tax=Chryseobacterium caseinilyticum TaxID=2771428 RepID=A0ABR8ZFP4_9FLAO|nr:hypothetical protein [Chryseobacterium caseinilyticum]MBD8084126.1 hypothetical protein [Chryseobacterium caseinilyticum]
MAKKGVYKISGNVKPLVGKKEYYTVDEWYSSTPLADRNPAKVIWELFIKTDNGFRTTNIKKKGINHFTFGKNAYQNVYKIEGYLHEPEGNSPMSLIVQPQKGDDKKATEKKDINNVILSYEDDTKINKPLSYRDRLKATAICEGLEGESIVFKLWEDDETGNGHHHKNQFITKSSPTQVNKFGKAKWSFSLSPTFITLANKRENDKSKHEYYVTAEFNGKILEDSQNVNVTNPENRTEKSKTAPQKPSFPKPLPKKETAKFPTRPTSPKKQNDPKSKILNAEFVDRNGKKINSVKIGTTVSIRIISKNMKDKAVTVKIWEDDTFNDDLLFEKKIRITNDEAYINNITLTMSMYEKGHAWETEGSTQEYYIEVEHLTVSTESSRIEVELQEEPKKNKITVSPAKVEKMPKQKFEKVLGLGKEALLYISSDIATEIKVDRNNKITFYPDHGGHNNITEYKEGGKIYTKKLPNGKSAYPLYKMYIYRGNIIGEAVKKLKQDLENKTRENAESTVLSVARHAQTNNKDYGNSGPIPPNTINSLYRIRYMQAWNHAGKESFRYRFVDDKSSNLKQISDFTKEVSSGAMTLGSRSSISIDPWKSKDLIGCLGIRNSDGSNHSSCSNEMSDLSSSNYKNVYHALNNYLETIIPELTGVYGRRGYSSNGRIKVVGSKYKEEVKVFALIEPLPELNKKEKLFNLNDAEKALKVIYSKYGREIARNVEMMYRWECSHFTSGQYQHCGGPGMEAANNTHPNYGWNGEMYEKFPNYSPTGLWDEFENKGMSGKGGNTQVTDRKKRYVQFPSVEAGMVYVAEFLVRHNGNIGRWHTTDVNRQADYVNNINKTIPRIVNSFK